ncbi:thioredoxin family protein [Arachnia propionica]|uniref:thioredoxin family protein n=1 Tax=Arachnia propionica TaxID=1750 RepID=UPI000F6F8C44|nr:thioredoxin family protein [Arachnia propionica]VEJ57674.1 Thiol:disulfide interchange protein [Arachnia propionica]
MKKYLLPLALSAVIVLGGCSQANSSSDAMSSAKSSSSATSHSDSASQSYITYDQYQASKDKYADSKVVLFFNAKWCPACRAINEALTSDPGKIPAKTTVVSVDYDQHTDLRQRYGVTTQHTFVQIDTNGEKTRQWVSTSVDALPKELQG